MCTGFDGAADALGQAGLPAQQRGAAGHAPAPADGTQLLARPRRSPPAGARRGALHGRNNVVLLLNELEQEGHVTRLRDPEDRRRHLVELTETGRAALAGAERAQESIEDQVLQALDPSERATLWRLLTRALQGAEPA